MSAALIVRICDFTVYRVSTSQRKTVLKEFVMGESGWRPWLMVAALSFAVSLSSHSLGYCLCVYLCVSACAVLAICSAICVCAWCDVCVLGRREVAEGI